MEINILPERLPEICPFQEEDTDFIVRRKRVAIGHKTGMGKTVMGLMALSRWKWNRGLILGSGATLPTWIHRTREWAGKDSVIPVTDSDTWKEALKGRNGLWVMTYARYEMLMRDVKGRPHWDVVIPDELHKLRNRQAKRTAAVMRIDSEYLLGLSATWSSRGAADLFPFMHLINRDLFSSYWAWVNTWCYVTQSDFGTEVVGVRNVENLRELMKNYYCARTWPEISGQMKGIYNEGTTRREMVELDMVKDQSRMYHELDKEMMVEVGDRLLITPTILAKLTRLRQMSICPRIFSPSAPLGSMVEYILESIEDDPHTIVFCPDSKALDIMEEELRNKGHQNIFQFRGAMKSSLIPQYEKEFQRTKGIALCTVQFAESFRIDSSYTAYMMGFDYAPDVNEQAEGRCRAINSPVTEPILVKYLMNRGTFDYQVKDIVNGKSMNVRAIFDQWDRVKK